MILLILSATALLVAPSMPNAGAGDERTMCSVEIALEAGWNLVCIPLEPADPTLEGVLGPLIAAGILEQVYSYTGDGLDPWDWYIAPPFPPELNDTIELHAGNGYWVKVSEATTLLVPSNYAEATTEPTVDLQTGWNLIGSGAQDPRTWDMMFGSNAAGELAHIAMYDASSNAFLDLDFPTSGPPVDPDTYWLRPAHGLWVKATSPFTFAPPVASQVAIAVFSGAGIASDFEESWYNEYTFESAGFDIDRPPLGCHGVEDTDAWNAVGDRAEDPDGNYGPDGFHPPVAGRYKMLINLGSPIAAPDPSNPGAVDPDQWRVYTGGLSVFMVANRPNIEP